LKELELRDAEAKLLKRGRFIESEGHLVREALLLLQQNSYTAARLARLLDIEHDSAETLITMMDKKGLARAGRTERGSTTIRKLPSVT